jgi:hypothetical protein
MIDTAVGSLKTKIYPSVCVYSGGKCKTTEEVRDHASIIRWAGFPGMCYYLLDPITAEALKAE